MDYNIFVTYLDIYSQGCRSMKSGIELIIIWNVTYHL